MESTMLSKDILLDRIYYKDLNLTCEYMFFYAGQIL
jgi:hypothetical protein